jgi:hypothetical protein
MSEATTEHGAIRLDRAYAAGMRHALAMAAQGEWDEARKVADRLSREALCVLRRFKNGKPSVTCHLSPVTTSPRKLNQIKLSPVTFW